MSDNLPESRDFIRQIVADDLDCDRHVLQRLLAPLCSDHDDFER